jgi:hypothetical protein
MNLTNDTLNFTDCVIFQTFNTYSDFARCYSFFFEANSVAAIFEIALVISVVVLNLAVILNILLTHKKILIYDHIIIGHSISNLVTGLVVIPFFHIQDILEYWPFGPVTAILWAAADGMVNTVTNLNMLYMSYARLRSIKSPKNFSNEILLHKPNYVIIAFWLISAGLWLGFTFLFKTFEFETHIDYHPHYTQSLINFFLWLLPLLIVLIISLYIIYYLKYKHHKTSSTHQHKSILHSLVTPQSKFSLIIASYLIQWSVPAVYIIFEPYLGDYYEMLTLSLKWPSYTVFKYFFLFNFSVI